MSHATRIYNVNALHTCARKCEYAYRGRRRPGERKVLHQLSACGVHAYARIYRRVHKLSSHYRSPRNTLYACKTAKTNAVPTTRMLRRRLYARGLDTVVRGFYTYGGSLMKRGQLCQPGADYLVEGPRRRCPFATVGRRRFRSPPVINSPMAARWLHSFSTSVGRARVNSVWAKWRLQRYKDECVSSFYGITVISSDKIIYLKTTC